MFYSCQDITTVANCELGYLVRQIIIKRPKYQEDFFRKSKVMGSLVQ